MYRWYERADTCLVYLGDVRVRSMEESTELHQRLNVLERLPVRPKWFSRGWTLQELIAPQAVEFFDSD